MITAEIRDAYASERDEAMGRPIADRVMVVFIQDRLIIDVVEADSYEHAIWHTGHEVETFADMRDGADLE